MFFFFFGKQIGLNQIQNFLVITYFGLLIKWPASQYLKDEERGKMAGPKNG